MLIYSILFLLLSNAVLSLRRDKPILFSRVTIIVLFYCCLVPLQNLIIQNSFKEFELYDGLFQIFIFFISGIIIQIIYSCPLFISPYKNMVIKNAIFIDICKAFNVTKVMFKPCNIFKVFVYLIFIGILCDVFVYLPFKLQIGVFIISLGMVIEIYDNKKSDVNFFILWLGKNKRYFFIFFILRSLSFYIIISSIFFLLPVDILFFNMYILPYLQESALKKLAFYFLDEFIEISSYYNFTVKCDSSDVWDDFIRRNPTVIMPPKYVSLWVLGPDINRSCSLLWYIGTAGNFNPYYWASFHPNSLKVFAQPDLSSQSTVLGAWPLPDCKGLFHKIEERTGGATYWQVDPRNTYYTNKPLYAKTTDGRYVETPFKIQRNIKRIRN